MLVISGKTAIKTTRGQRNGFNLAIEMLVISGSADVSESGGFRLCFNLAIEMLVISGQKPRFRDGFCSFQSRNRDACHFRVIGFSAKLGVV